MDGTVNPTKFQFLPKKKIIGGEKMGNIDIVIDGKKVAVPEGRTILEAAIMPTLAAAWFMPRYIIRGLTFGAVKG